MAVLLLVVGDVFDDVDGVRLPHRYRDFNVLFNWHMNLFNDFVWPLDWNMDFLDDFEWNLPHDLNRYWPLNLDVLGFVDWVRNVLDDVHMDGVRLWNWHFHFIRLWDGHRVRDSNLDVARNFDRNAADHVLDDGLEFVSRSFGGCTSDANGLSDNPSPPNGTCEFSVSMSCATNCSTFDSCAF